MKKNKNAASYTPLTPVEVSEHTVKRHYRGRPIPRNQPFPHNKKTKHPRRVQWNPEGEAMSLATYKQKLDDLARTGKESTYKAVLKVGETAGLSTARIQRDARAALGRGRKAQKRSNPLQRSGTHNVEVSKHYRSGGTSQRQRAIERGQMDFFGESPNNRRNPKSTSNPKSTITKSAINPKSTKNGFFSSAKEFVQTRPYKITAERKDKCKCPRVSLGKVRATDSDSALDAIKAKLSDKGDLGLYSNFQISGRKISVNPKTKTNGAARNPQPTPRLKELHKMFAGRDIASARRELTSRFNPVRGAKLGGLSFLKLQNGERIDFDPEVASLNMSEGKELFISGAQFEEPDGLRSPEERLMIDEVAVVGYVTAKDHIGDGETFEFYHQMGEENGERPVLLIDGDGFPLLQGGSYEIEARGIVN